MLSCPQPAVKPLLRHLTLATPQAASVNRLLAQLPQLRGYHCSNLLILHNPVKKVVTTNLVFCIFWAESV
jgi:hypothetical protein